MDSGALVPHLYGEKGCSGMLWNAPASRAVPSRHEQPPKERREREREEGVEVGDTLGVPPPYTLARVVARETTSSSIPEPPSQNISGLPLSLCSVGVTAEKFLNPQSHTCNHYLSCFLKGGPSSLRSFWIFFLLLFPKQGLSPMLSFCPITCLYAFKCLPTQQATLDG